MEKIAVSKHQYQRLMLEVSTSAMQGLLAAEQENYNYGGPPDCYSVVAQMAKAQAQALLDELGYVNTDQL